MLEQGMTIDRHTLSKATPCDKQTASAEVRRLRKEGGVAVLAWGLVRYHYYPIIGLSDGPDVPKPEKKK